MKKFFSKLIKVVRIKTIIEEVIGNFMPGGQTVVRITNDFNDLKSPILHKILQQSHGKDFLKQINRFIMTDNRTDISIDDSAFIDTFIELIRMCGNNGWIELNNAIGHTNPISIDITNADFILAVYEYTSGRLLSDFKNDVINQLQSTCTGEQIADNLGINISYIHAMFRMLEVDGIGDLDGAIGFSAFYIHNQK